MLCLIRADREHPACYLHAGAADAYYQFQLKPWDIAAGALLIEEAGGTISTSDGCAWSVFDRSLVATNDLLHKQVRKSFA